MKCQKTELDEEQKELFKTELSSFLNEQHGMVQLAHQIDWKSFDKEFEGTWIEGEGRPGISTRLMTALHYLKYTFDMSDEGVLEEWIQNAYWQYLSGMRYFQHELPIEVSSMSRWRKRVGKRGAEKLLTETIMTGMRLKVIKVEQMKRVNVDTTVQEKEVRFPTDSRLYDRARELLVKRAQKEGIALRQSYRGYGVEEERVSIHVDKVRRGRTAKRLWKWMKRRAAIEPSIGHLKREHRMNRNRLHGADGDMFNAILSASGMNFRKLLKFACALFHSCFSRLLSSPLSLFSKFSLFFSPSLP